MPALKKKVLIVTYYFPPSGGSGVQRPLKFIKYLREFGWEPVVLTAKNADYPAYDETLIDEIPAGVKIYRSGIVEPYNWYRKITGRSAGESTDIATLTLDELEKQKLSERISEWVRSALFVPDARICWLPFAIRLGLKVIAKEKIDIIFSTSPPYTTSLIGLWLNRLSGIPWVTDFRDSWIGWVTNPQWRPKLSRAVELKMETAVLKYADRIITATPGEGEDLLSRNPQLRDHRWRVLYNGFDSSDFKKITPKPRSDKITIIYNGSLYGNRNPEYLLQVLEDLKKEGSDVIEKIRLLFVGRIGDAIINRMESSSISSVIERVPYVTHNESLAYLMSADISLLIVDNANTNWGIIPGKVFEYIGAGKPVLTLTPEGDTANLIRTYNIGTVAPPDDKQKIRKVFLEMVKHIKIGEREKRSDMYRFERRSQTGELAAVFDELHEAKTKVRLVS
ncbi:glycosyltransferase family 4 protein [candidate division KSB1 bacterium]|nr:glycosyltransferase family 4 protein [candidate division KSB1 bacterium]